MTEVQNQIGNVALLLKVSTAAAVLSGLGDSGQEVGTMLIMRRQGMGTTPRRSRAGASFAPSGIRPTTRDVPAEWWGVLRPRAVHRDDLQRLRPGWWRGRVLLLFRPRRTRGIVEAVGHARVTSPSTCRPSVSTRRSGPPRKRRRRAGRGRERVAVGRLVPPPSRADTTGGATDDPSHAGHGR